MNENIKILLNSKKNINSVNLDSNNKILLSNNQTELTEYDINNIINATQVFDIERESTNIYRIYSGIEYLSLLNGVDINYSEFIDFFKPNNNSNILGKSIFNSFDFYLVKPSNDFENIINNIFIRKFEVIAVNNDIDIFNAGFSKNIFNEQKYILNLNKDIDITDYYDYFGFPCTELYLFVVYKPNNNEIIYQRQYDSNNYQINEIQYNTYNIGDLIYGDLISYNENDFKQDIKLEQMHYIDTPCMFNNVENIVRWSYNPFIPIKLRYFSDEVQRVNKNTSLYEQAISIPSYAINIGDDNYVWRKILPQGFIDPLTGVGNNCPFVNKKRYLFENLKLIIKPDLTHENTELLFNNIIFSEPTISNVIPISDINNMNLPCQ